MRRSTHSGPVPRVTGSVRLTLTGNDRDLRARAFELERLWPGTAIHFDVGAVEPWETTARDLVHLIAHATHAQALAVDVIGEPRAVSAWVHELRAAVNAHAAPARVGGDAS